jgi:hypothetical protein
MILARVSFLRLSGPSGIDSNTWIAIPTVLIRSRIPMNSFACAIVER